ncbi:MAG TPA: SPOR domain-containing protein [Spirochaetia bacterium]|nr:SPOR domain-containing protein [Spirochaetia bacterium]
MKRWIVLCLLMVPLLASAESYWEGSAALQRGDAAFEGGLYAASNSFAPDTVLLVQNLDSGRNTTATVSERADGPSNILVFLSPRAADAIGLTTGSVARVRVIVLQKAASATGSAAPESTFNPDQDVNPGAAYSATRTAEQQNTAQPTEAQQGGTPQPAGQPATTQPQETHAAPQIGTASVQESQENADAARILAEAEARRPQKQLFLPPREDQKFAYKPPVPQEQTVASQPPQASQPAAASTPEAPPETPSVTGETSAPRQQPAEVPLAEARPDAAATPQEAAGSTPQPGQSEAGTQLALPEAGHEGTASEQQTVQAQPRGAEGERIALQPPATPPQQAAPSEHVPTSSPAATAPQEGTSTGVQVVASLPKLSGKKNAATFYVQLGAYATQEGARDIAVRLVETYPVVVLTPSSSDTQMYKVLVGPLNRAESGTLLPLFKFRGFRDAFVRRE